jgi:hypothetical protein
MITIWIIPGLQNRKSVHDLMDEIEKAAKASSTTHSKTLSENSESILVESETTDPPQSVEYVLCKVMRGEQAMHIIQYSNKNLDPPQKTFWIKNFDNARILHLKNLSDPSSILNPLTT